MPLAHCAPGVVCPHRTRQAQEAQELASAANIAAFNLGNALGAWVGGVVIAHGPGLAAVTWVATALPLAAVAVAGYAMRAQRAAPRTPVQACA